MVANDPSEAQAAALAGLAGRRMHHAPGTARRDRVDGDAPGLGGGPQRGHPARGRARGDPHGHERRAACGDLVTELVAALEDATVAVTGPFGLVSTDMRRFEDAPDGAGDVDAIEGYALAFRRADYVTRGPLDEHFVFYRNLDIWWSLVLRDQAEDEADDAPPRRAVRVAAASVTRHAHRGWTSLPDEERDRASKKNFYRVLKRFATRRDLLVSGDRRSPALRVARRRGTARPHASPPRPRDAGADCAARRGSDRGSPVYSGRASLVPSRGLPAGFAGGRHAWMARPGLGEGTRWNLS